VAGAVAPVVVASAGELDLLRVVVMRDSVISPGVDILEVVMSFEIRKIAVTDCLVLLVLLVLLAACSKSDKPSPGAFASPDAAGNALLEAAKSGDQNAVLAIFGPESKEIILSGDAVQDKTTVEAFVAAYQQMHRWRRMPDDSQILLIGADNFAFPVPLRKMLPGNGSSTRLQESMRFWHAVLAGTNSQSLMSAERWPTLRRNISQSITMTEARTTTP
jgi:hypothetical protein